MTLRNVLGDEVLFIGEKYEVRRALDEIEIRNRVTGYRVFGSVATISATLTGSTLRIGRVEDRGLVADLRDQRIGGEPSPLAIWAELTRAAQGDGFSRRSPADGGARG